MIVIKQISATISQESGEVGWANVMWPESVEYFGTRGLGKAVGDTEIIDILDTIEKVNEKSK